MKNLFICIFLVAILVAVFMFIGCNIGSSGSSGSSKGGRFVSAEEIGTAVSLNKIIENKKMGALTQQNWRNLELSALKNTRQK